MGTLPLQSRASSLLQYRHARQLIATAAGGVEYGGQSGQQVHARGVAEVDECCNGAIDPLRVVIKRRQQVNDDLLIKAGAHARQVCPADAVRALSEV